jgi:hypothetical protein
MILESLDCRFLIMPTLQEGVGNNPQIRCLFCKADSSASRSVEHIIPESLGNTRHVLPRGVVCDVCNNYFARKVEAPFLDSPAIKRLRFHQELENKRGRVPSISGLITPDIPALVTRLPRENLTSVKVSRDALEAIAQRPNGRLIVPLTGATPADAVVARFLAKVALEFMAHRIVRFPEGLAYLCDEEQLDPIRRYARVGSPSVWPVHERIIYGADDYSLDENGRRIQIVHESDFLVTSMGEWYFVLAIFGVEFAINIGDPSTEGYVQWLEANQGLSPLYSTKNLGCGPMPRKAI